MPRIELESDAAKPLLDYGPFDDDDELVSKSFSGSGGPAYLFRTVFNTVAKKPEDRLLLTGRHVIANLTCRGCDAPLGWTYIRAYDTSQKYKEGKHILEKNRINKARPQRQLVLGSADDDEQENGWEAEVELDYSTPPAP